MGILHIFLAFIMCLTWGTDYIVSKEALTIVPPILLSSFRFAIVAFCLLPFCRRIPPNLLLLSIISFALAVLTYGFGDIGIHLNSSTTVANLIIEANVVVSVIFAAIFLREKINKFGIIGVALAFFGMALVAVGNSFDFDIHGYELNKQNLLSILALIVVVFCWPLYKTLSKKLENKISPLEIIAWTAFIGSIQGLIVSLFFESNHLEILHTIDTKLFLLILYTGIGGVIIPNKILHMLIRVYGVIKASIISLFVPLIVATESYLFFDEKFSVIILVGGLMLLFGIYITNISMVKDDELCLEKPV